MLESADDCEWIVDKAKQHLEQKDKHGARAWIITAKSLFPYRFIVQYEALMVHLACDEYQGATQSLLELCINFAKEVKLQSLVIDVVQASSGSGQQVMDGGENGIKLRKLYEMLPLTSQKKLLLTTADAIDDPLEKGKLAVIVLKIFPDATLSLGLDLYDILSQSFSRSTVPAADNKHRNLLVTELIPILATSPHVAIEQPFLRSTGQNMVLKTSHICQWLEVAASFYTTLTVQELLLGKSHPCAGKAGWESLHHVFLAVCDKCTWMEIYHHKQIGPRLPLKVRWIGLQNISGYNPLRVSFEVPRGVAIACFYISVFLFFEAAWTYYSYVHQVFKDGGSKCWALIEDVPKTTAVIDEKPAKKRKLAEDNEGRGKMATINIQTGSRTPDPTVIESFIVAVDCWSFLHASSTYRGEFSRLCQQWGAMDWSWMAAFKIDMALYKGDHDSYKKLLQTERQKIKREEISKVENVRILLQLVNAYLLIGDCKSACNLATELISHLPHDSNEVDSSVDKSGYTPSSPSAKSGRSLQLICCSDADIVPYTLDIILGAVKDLVFSDSCTDNAIGQLMVLSQYKWPKSMDLFRSIISVIQTRKSFNYNKFFDYIIIIEILEEIMYLINQGTVKINILPIDTSTRAHTVTTRGVNSKAKEELMNVMDKQLTKCGDNVVNVIRNFFKNERLCFIMND